MSKRDDAHDDEDDSRPWERDRPKRRRRRRRDDDDDDDEEWDSNPDREWWGITPANTTPLAIAAGYVGLISVLCIPAPFALLLGILALRELRRKPKLDGRYRATFAIVMGVVFSLPLPFIVIAVLANGK